MKNQAIESKISIPYAEALFGLAKDKNLFIEIKQDLSIISTILEQSKDLKVFLTNPLISGLIKKNVLEKLFKDKINNFIFNFLLLLIDRRRFYLLNIIIDKYLQLVYDLESTIVAELVTATELSEIQQQNLINQIKIMTKSSNVNLSISIDTSLIGGFVLKIGSKIMDASLAGKLKQMSLYLMKN